MSLDLPGFADPVADAQSCFRALLDAMARPGRIHEAGNGLTPPAPLDAATAAVLLTLADHDTPLWLASDAASAWDWIAFHCGCPRASHIERAAFALALTLPDLASLHAGTDEEPERAATLILQVHAIGRGRSFRLTGPGLRTPAAFAVDGVPDDFAARWSANHALYPRGIDLVLCAGHTLAALPRSIAVEDA